MTKKRHLRRKRLRRALCLLCVGLALLLTACFRDASEVIEEPPVAREVISPTALVTDAPADATELPADSQAEEAPPEVIATEAPPDNFALTATALLSRLTEAASLQNDAVSDEIAATSAPATVAIQPTLIPLERATVPPGEDCIHEIRVGETLYMLSLAYGSTVNEIADASGINDVDRITVGQRIIIPGCGTAGFAPPPTSQPTATVDAEALLPPAVTSEAVVVAVETVGELNALAQRARDTILSNAQAGLAAQIASDDPQATPSRRYTVQQNDTLLEIALRFGTTVETLAALNNITDVNTVATGDVLWIP